MTRLASVAAMVLALLSVSPSAAGFSQTAAAQSPAVPSPASSATRLMTVTFPEGNEPPWTILLTGSTAISDAFGRCVTDLTRQAQSAPPPAPTVPAEQ